MKVTGAVKWIEGLQFSARTDSGQELVLDVLAGESGGGTGPTPKELVPVALGGCTGMDVIGILGKMRQDVAVLEVVVEGEIADEHPRRFTAFTVTFHVTGEGIDPAEVERAIVLSRDRYCSVSVSLDPAVEKYYYFTINGGKPQAVAPPEKCEPTVRPPGGGLPDRPRASGPS